MIVYFSSIVLRWIHWWNYKSGYCYSCWTIVKYLLHVIITFSSFNRWNLFSVQAEQNVKFNENFSSRKHKGAFLIVPDNCVKSVEFLISIEQLELLSSEVWSTSGNWSKNKIRNWFLIWNNRWFLSKTGQDKWIHIENNLSWWNSWIIPLVNIYSNTYFQIQITNWETIADRIISDWKSDE